MSTSSSERRRKKALGGVIGAAFALTAATGAQACSMPADEIPPARDGDIAIRQELDAARKAATLAAYDLFIARHPDHALAREARREREQLVRAHARR